MLQAPQVGVEVHSSDFSGARVEDQRGKGVSIPGTEDSRKGLVPCTCRAGLECGS